MNRKRFYVGFIDKRFKHGYCYTKLYTTWTGIKKRCNDSNNKSYKNYGGRGITVCPEWNDFLIFRFQMRKKYLDAKNKYKEKLISIERIDNDKGYYYENCIFIPFGLQSKNRRCVYPVKAINRQTGKGVYAENQRELAKKINISKDMINLSVKNKTKLSKWIIRPLLKPQLNERKTND